MCYFKFAQPSTQTIYLLLYRYLFQVCSFGAIFGSANIANQMPVKNTSYAVVVGQIKEAPLSIVISQWDAGNPGKYRSFACIRHTLLHKFSHPNPGCVLYTKLDI